MYHYFVSYRTEGGFGRDVVEVNRPIKKLEDIEYVEAIIGKKVNKRVRLDNFILLGWENEAWIG